MDFLKRNLFLILCGVGAAGGIALGVTGMQAMPKVQSELSSAANVYKGLESIQPVNEKSLDAEQARIDAILADHAKIVERAQKLYDYTPLVDGVFPDGPPEKRVAFRNKYNEEIRKVFASLQSGGPPTPVQIEQFRDRIENEKAAEKSFGADPAKGGPTRTRADVLTEAGVREDPVARASVANAQSLVCYAVNFFEDKPPERVASLEFIGAMRDTTTVEAPDDESCWRAQLSYWIQKDVVDAINAVNQEAVSAAKAADKHVWVGIMPVKDVISIRLSSYVPPQDALYKSAQPGGYGPGLPPGTAESVFTGTVPTDAYDVIQFTVKLVMDQRDIPLLVERLSNDSPHTLLRVSYEAVPPNKSMTGKVYGSEPAVNVVLDFETVFLGDLFRPLIPESVCERYEIKCPKR